MKRIISIILVVSITLSLACVSVGAVDYGNDAAVEDTAIIVDSVGNEYELSYAEDGNTATATLAELDGTLVSESVLNFATGEIVSTVLVEVVNTGGLNEAASIPSNGGQYVTITENIQDYIVEESPIMTREGAYYDPRYGDHEYITYQTGMRTEFEYKGQTLTGDCSYMCTGYYDEYNRESFQFVRGTVLSAIVVVLTNVWSGAQISVLSILKMLLEEFGISWAESIILEDFEPIVAVRAFDFYFRTKMRPANVDVVMCVIEKQIEYAWAEVNGVDSLLAVDMISYSNQDDAINGMCRESLGYAAYAFEAKYITQTYPNLPLPVSGPPFTWDV